MKKQNKLLLIFFILTLGWTWIVGLLPYIFGFGNLPLGDFLFKFVAGPAPSIVGLILVFISYPKEAKKDYFNRMFSFKRMGLKWPLITMAFFAMLSAVNIFISTTFWGAAMPGFSGILQLASQPYMILLFLLFAIISGPLNEEFGWRGFALDKLFVKFGFWKGSLLLGLIWGIWHIPWYFYPGNGQYMAWHVAPIHGFAYIASAITLSFMVSIVYIKTNRSALAGAFVHMISNFFTGSMLIYPFDDTYIISCFYVTIILEGIVIALFACSKKFRKEIGSSIVQIKQNDIAFGMVSELA